MDGFTGLDIEKSKQQIDEFVTLAEKADAFIGNMLGDFFGILNQKWASPNAVECTTKYTNSFYEFGKNFQTTYIHVMGGAVDAGNTLCRANGVETCFEVYGNDLGTGESGPGWDLYTCEENINGLTGMAVENVRIARDTLVSQKDKAVSMLEAIPTQIEFYSTDGSLMNAYKTGIDSFVSQFSETFDSLVTEINGYIETEENNILLAKEQATQNMAA